MGSLGNWRAVKFHHVTSDGRKILDGHVLPKRVGADSPALPKTEGQPLPSLDAGRLRYCSIRNSALLPTIGPSLKKGTRPSNSARLGASQTIRAPFLPMFWASEAYHKWRHKRPARKPLHRSTSAADMSQPANAKRSRVLSMLGQAQASISRERALSRWTDRHADGQTDQTRPDHSREKLRCFSSRFIKCFACLMANIQCCLGRSHCPSQGMDGWDGMGWVWCRSLLLPSRFEDGIHGTWPPRRMWTGTYRNGVSKYMPIGTYRFVVLLYRIRYVPAAAVAVAVAVTESENVPLARP